MPRIFISHSGKDTSHLEKLYLAIRSNTVEDCTPPDWGTRWEEETNTAIKASDVFILLLTTNAAKSKDVQKEYKFATKCNKPVIALVSEEAIKLFPWSENKSIKTISISSNADDNLASYQRLKSYLEKDPLTFKDREKSSGEAKKPQAIRLKILGEIILEYIGRSNTDTKTLAQAVNITPEKLTLLLQGKLPPEEISEDLLKNILSEVSKPKNHSSIETKVSLTSEAPRATEAPNQSTIKTSKKVQLPKITIIKLPHMGAAKARLEKRSANARKQRVSARLKSLKVPKLPANFIERAKNKKERQKPI